MPAPQGAGVGPDRTAVSRGARRRRPANRSPGPSHDDRLPHLEIGCTRSSGQRSVRDRYAARVILDAPLTLASKRPLVRPLRRRRRTPLRRVPPVLVHDGELGVMLVGDVLAVGGIGDGAQLGALDAFGLVEQDPLTRLARGLSVPGSWSRHRVGGSSPRASRRRLGGSFRRPARRVERSPPGRRSPECVRCRRGGPAATPRSWRSGTSSHRASRCTSSR